VARKANRAEMTNFHLQVQPRLTMRRGVYRFSLSYQRILSWDAVMKLARPLRKMSLETSSCTTA